MAEDLIDNGEFWLPPQFLTDDDILMDFNTIKKTDFGYGLFGPGPNSDLSSPVESVVGSTETESDEEDYLAGLTKKLSRSTLQDNFWKIDNTHEIPSSKAWGVSGSPQSTLCNVLGSSRGSPNCPSQVSSPPPGMTRNDAAWDLLYAAAGEVARMRMAEEGAGFYNNRGLLGPARKPSPIAVPQKTPNPNPNPNFGYQSYHQFQAAQFQQLKQQQMMKQQQYQQKQAQQMVQNRARNNNGRPLGLSPSAWPTLQQSQQQQTPQPGSGMRAVFLGNPSAKRESTGTGVFLPRRIGAPIETRKKPACSTVLLPDRVVQALNLNLEPMASPAQIQPPRCNGNLPDYDAALKYRNNVMLAQQRRGSVRPPPVLSTNEVRLPQEWTY